MKPDTSSEETQNEHGHKISIFGRLRRSFLTGLVFIAPLFITGYVIWWAVNFIDRKTRPFIPDQYENIEIFGYNIPGIGVISFVIGAILIGAITRSLVGRQINRLVHGTVNSFPIVRTIYNALKQIMETIFSGTERNFQQACLIEYPRKGIYAIGFIAARARGEINEKSGQKVVAVFVPTTPNPTSGFLLYFPENDITILDMSVEDAAKLVISSGLVEPEHIKNIEADDEKEAQ